MLNIETAQKATTSSSLLILNPGCNFNWSHTSRAFAVQSSEGLFEMPLHLFVCLNFFISGRTRNEAVSFLEKQYPEDQSSLVLEQLVRNRILVTQESATKVDSWISKRWRNAYHFHSAARNVRFHEEEEDFDLSKFYSSAKFTTIDNSESIPLPEPKDLNATSLATVLQQRRTKHANFHQATMPMESLSEILYFATSPLREIQTFIRGNYHKDHTVLKHSAYLPFSVFVGILDVHSLTNGIYRYTHNHSLSLVSRDFDGNKASRFAIGQDIGKASVVFILSCNFACYQSIYCHSRSLRNVLVDVASLAHRLILSSTALQYKNFLTPALRDSLVCGSLGIDGINEHPLYFVACGK